MRNPWGGNYTWVFSFLRIIFLHVGFEHDALSNRFLTFHNYTTGLYWKLVNSYNAVVLCNIGQMETIDKRVRINFYILLLITSIMLISPCDDDPMIWFTHGRHPDGKQAITFLGRWSTPSDLCMLLAMKIVDFYHILLRHSDISYTQDRDLFPLWLDEWKLLLFCNDNENHSESHYEIYWMHYIRMIYTEGLFVRRISFTAAICIYIYIYIYTRFTNYENTVKSVWYGIWLYQIYHTFARGLKPKRFQTLLNKTNVQM